MLLSTPWKVLKRILVERIKASVDQYLRENQAGFRKDWSCPDHIAHWQLLEWKSSVYINFIDFEKAFDSVDRDSLWKIIRHYGIPTNTSLLLWGIDWVLHGGIGTGKFRVLTGVRQGCILLPFLFLMTIDWVMKQRTCIALRCYVTFYVALCECRRNWTRSAYYADMVKLNLHLLFCQTLSFSLNSSSNLIFMKKRLFKLVFDFCVRDLKWA